MNSIFPKWAKNKEENDNMPPEIHVIEKEAKELLPPEVMSSLPLLPTIGDSQDPPGNPGENQGDKPKTRFETLQEQLTKEQYIALKEEGLSDKDVSTRIGLPYWADSFTKLKRQWNINDLGIKKTVQTVPSIEGPTVGAAAIQERIDNIRQHLNEPREEPMAQAPPGLTIAQAMELRDELTQDVDDFDHVIVTVEKHVSSRVIQILRLNRDTHLIALDHINEVFSSTVVRL
jgi:hypothetical protein